MITFGEVCEILNGMSSRAREPQPAAHRSPRRSPRPTERRRDPERTRARILAAAAEELSEKGITAVRVGAIADRAGVNKQLISYYFGGKDGLLRALGDQWRRQKSTYDTPALPLPELVAVFVRAGANDSVATRLLSWEGLTYTKAGDDPDFQARSEQAQRDIADMHRRQQAGELAEDLDPACMLLAFIAAGVAPVLLPHIAHSLFGADADSPEFAERYAEQISRMVAHLAAQLRDAE